MVIKLTEWAEITLLAVIVARFIAIVSGDSTKDFLERTEEAAYKALGVMQS